jgi:hypothetical protein
VSSETGTDGIERVAFRTTMSTNQPPRRAGAIGIASGDADTLSRPEVCDTLCNEGHQRIVQYARQEGESALESSDPAEHGTAWKADVHKNEAAPTQRRRVHTDLGRTRLLKLDETRVVKPDSGTNRVELADAADRVGLSPGGTPGDGAGGHARYLALSAVSVWLVDANWVGMYPIGAVSITAIGGVVLATLAVVALWRAVAVRSNSARTSERFRFTGE